jgi:myo-inositol-1(or 4)-monophosphatase
MTNFAGGLFNIDSREVLASNSLIHQALISEFQQIFAGRGLESLDDPRAYKK